LIFIIALTPLWAKEMQDAKLDHIDDAMRLHELPDASGVQTTPKRLSAHPEFPRAAFHAPAFTQDALKTIAELEWELERRPD